MIEGSVCGEANQRLVLGLQVNGDWSQAYRDWWERWRVKACSIRALKRWGPDALTFPGHTLYITMEILHVSRGIQAKGYNWARLSTDVIFLWHETRIWIVLLSSSRGKSLLYIVVFVGPIHSVLEYQEIINRRWLCTDTLFLFICQCSSQTSTLNCEEERRHSLTFTEGGWLPSLPAIGVRKEKKLAVHWQSLASQTGVVLAGSFSVTD